MHINYVLYMYTVHKDAVNRNSQHRVTYNIYIYPFGHVFTWICLYSHVICLHRHLIHLILHIDRKLKKLARAIKNKGSTEKEKEEGKPPQQWNLDYALAAFEGLTPEYMEMSESACTYRIIVTGTMISYLSTEMTSLRGVKPSVCGRWVLIWPFQVNGQVCLYCPVTVTWWKNIMCR